jgi:imidazolonepropionase
MSERIAADLVLRGAGELVTMDRPDECGSLARGALAARGGAIVWVGRDEDFGSAVAVADDGVVVDAQGACVLPGFVDAHTHAVFAGGRAHEYAARLGGTTYAEILAGGGGINATVRATREAPLEELERLTRARLDSFLAHGTTTVEIKTGYGLSLEAEKKQLAAARVDHPVRRALTLLPAHFVPPEFAGRDDEYVSYVCDEVLPALKGEADFVDVFCDEGAFTVGQTRRVFDAATALGFGLKVHAEELARTGGARLAAEYGCVSADHLIFADGDDIAALRAAGVVAVALPGTSYTLHAAYAPARAFLDDGVTLALATDFNPGTCYCENMQMVISLACQEMRLTPDEALYAATMGGAAALGLQREVGSLEVGKSCDFIVLDAESRHELPYHWGVNLVEGAIVGGAGPADVAAGDGAGPQGRGAPS